MTDGRLAEAYQRLHRMGPEFDGDEDGNNGLTNHGPMAAEVLARRGFADEITGWVDAYIPKLVELPRSRQQITDRNWSSALGEGTRVGDWVDFFTGRLDDRPWRDVLVQWWPRLLPGIAAGATHGVIRVSHAVRALTAGEAEPAAVAELGHGLAFWAARSRPIPRAEQPSGTLDPADALSGVPHLLDQTGLIVDRLGRLTDMPTWPAAQAALRAPVDADDVVTVLERLVDAATLRYLTHAHGSPVLLVHTATAPNAVLHTLPSLPRELWAPSLSAVWTAAAAIVSAYEPGYAVPRGELPNAPAGNEPVAEVVQRATDHGDEHVIKFTDTAVEVFERTQDPDALAAACLIRTLL